MAQPDCIVVMGVSGSGKTTLARGIADRMHWRFQEGDDLHPPANVAKMAHGEPLTDEDRWPWLDAIGRWIDTQSADGASCVVTCSALRRAYRDVLTVEPAELDEADLIVLPGTKSTVDDLAWLRSSGLALPLERHVAVGKPLLGICGGYQMLAERIHDSVESRRGTVDGLGLVPIEITFGETKVLGRPVGSCDGVPVRGYEIHHGYESRRGSVAPLLIVAGAPEGVRAGNVFGTHWHGTFEGDEFRRWFLTEVAQLAGRDFNVAPDNVFGAARERMLDRLGDLVENHLDTEALWRLILGGTPTLPTIRSGAYDRQS